MDLGIDSLDAQKFVQNLQEAFTDPFGVKVSGTIMFEHANVKELSKYLHAELQKLLDLQTPSAPPPAKAPKKFVMAPPGNNAFYRRHETIPYYNLRDVAKKMGANDVEARLWVAQRGVRNTVLTIEMIDAVYEEMAGECW